MSKKRRVFTSTAPVEWSGEMGPEFRQRAEQILDRKGNPPRPLSDPAWNHLWSVVHSFASSLAHMESAGLVADQRKLLQQAIRHTEAMLVIADALEAPDMGRAMTGLVNSAWEREFDHGHAYDRDRDVALGELSSVTDQDTALELLSIWERRLFLKRPWPVADFLVDARVFLGALKRAASDLDNGDWPTAREPFEELVAMLCIWGDAHSIKLGASKLDAYEDGHGALTYLVQEIIRQVPETPGDKGGLKYESTLRYQRIADATLAEYVLAARKLHQNRMRRLGGKLVSAGS